jgi:hypothetical protein
MSAGQLQGSREYDDRLTTPAGATSTPSMITVMTETPSGMDRNINGIIGIYMSRGIYSYFSVSTDKS